MPRFIDSPHKALSTAVILQAIHDKRRQRPAINAFFQSDWFETLADLAMINPDVVRKKLKIPPCKKRKIT
jgi:hypothetical protein